MFNSIRYKARLKLTAKIGKLTKKPQFLGSFIFFAKSLGRVQFIKIQSPLKEQSKNDSKPEIFDFADAPLPRRLEGCGRPLGRQSLQTFTAA
ncbi:hypothetical protein A0O21_01785 [Streptococcus pantholopis]|uniref:Uncharacterized protein n=1 Tax=Streptococcus pantholopis TaxID=1811193 RepID=A0A172Q5W5_9STRE|nr:hypothetical protein A0O21_01785 [Streptococcus pantholopis]